MQVSEILRQMDYTTTSITLNDSTAIITFSNTIPLTWTLTLKQGMNTLSKKGVICQTENMEYLACGNAKSPPTRLPPANPDAEW